MTSTSLQSRISTFESLSHSNSSPRPIPRRKSPPRLSDFLESPPSPAASKLQPITTRSSSPSSTTLNRKVSLVDLRDWVVDDGPSPPRSSKMNGNGHAATPTKFDVNKSPPLINLESPPKSRTVSAPPLPPRKPSLGNIKAAAAAKTIPPALPLRSDSLTVQHTYPPVKLDIDTKSKSGSGHAPASSISSFHSVSLSSDTDPSTPGSVANFIATFPVDLESATASEGDSISLDESFENVSTTSFGSPTTAAMITHDWEKAIAKRGSTAPPRLPQRPPQSPKPPSANSPPPQHPSSTNGSPILGNSRHSSPTSSKIRLTTSNSSAASASTARRAPPPPPSSRSTTSDRSSILSNATSISSSSNHPYMSYRKPPPSLPKQSLTRPTPVPTAARRRYECVFNANVKQKKKAEKDRRKKGTEGKPALLSPMAARKTRQAAGWRGLSVDLITGNEHPTATNGDSGKQDGDDEDEDGLVESDARLDGHVVSCIWARSKLSKAKLKEIWNECDPANKGSLDADAFVKGMWRIDEELRRAQLRPSMSRNNSASSLQSFRRQVPIPRPKPKVVLR